jgi:hypothetical protein
MILREYNGVRFKQEIDATVEKLKSVSAHAGGMNASNYSRSDKLR